MLALDIRCDGIWVEVRLPPSYNDCIGSIKMLTGRSKPIFFSISARKCVDVTPLFSPRKQRKRFTSQPGYLQLFNFFNSGFIRGMVVVISNKVDKICYCDQISVTRILLVQVQPTC